MAFLPPFPPFPPLGKQNVEIKCIYLEIEKSENKLFLRPYILVNFNG